MTDSQPTDAEKAELLATTTIVVYPPASEMSDEQRARLLEPMALYKTHRHMPMVPIPCRVTELETEIEDLEAKLRQVRHLVEYIWECPESAIALMTPGSVADDLDKILDPPVSDDG